MNAGDYTFDLDECQRQLVLLGLAILSLDRPGFEYACRESAKRFGGEETFDSFRTSNYDRKRIIMLPWAAMLAERTLPDRRYAALMPLFFGARIGAGQSKECQQFDDVWDYDDLTVATVAFGAWEDGEPEGWVRHMPSKRRRPGGDASKEYIHE